MGAISFINYDFNLSFSGAFLIPYFIFMFLCAFPLFFLEMSYAQFSNLGPGKAWICVPLLRGNVDNVCVIYNISML